ncbi:pre-mRNA-splicing factor CWC22 homolog isoform X2 [Lutzomyia longipalpis]|uniref:pre-mRNA-splicing factor CWC22 homolog isoform X2 n=1 Tax=Lutzomyia longipalpis TaxID=7200 RepID=UPI00248378EF|nr:pre-mRNA-splicing factor CWC22 homolog isoform X2 [Lutzomyia longipalpis]
MDEDKEYEEYVALKEVYYAAMERFLTEHQKQESFKSYKERIQKELEDSVKELTRKKKDYQFITTTFTQTKDYKRMVEDLTETLQEVHLENKAKKTDFEEKSNIKKILRKREKKLEASRKSFAESDLAREVAKVEEEVNEANLGVKELKEEFTKLSDLLNAAENNEMEKKLKEEKEEIAALERKDAQLETEKSARQKRIETQRKETEELTKEISHGSTFSDSFAKLFSKVQTKGDVDENEEVPDSQPTELDKLPATAEVPKGLSAADVMNSQIQANPGIVMLNPLYDLSDTFKITHQAKKGSHLTFSVPKIPAETKIVKKHRKSTPAKQSSNDQKEAPKVKGKQPKTAAPAPTKSSSGKVTSSSQGSISKYSAPSAVRKMRSASSDDRHFVITTQQSTSQEKPSFDAGQKKVKKISGKARSSLPDNLQRRLRLMSSDPSTEQNVKAKKSSQSGEKSKKESAGKGSDDKKVTFVEPTGTSQQKQKRKTSNESAEAMKSAEVMKAKPKQVQESKKIEVLEQIIIPSPGKGSSFLISPDGSSMDMGSDLDFNMDTFEDGGGASGGGDSPANFFNGSSSENKKNSNNNDGFFDFF